MKRLAILLTLLLLTGGATLHGQEREKNLLSVRGGLTVAHMRATLDDLSGITGTRAGYHIEVADEVLLHRRLPLYIETGIGFTSGGGSYDRLALRPMYFRIPLLLNTRIRLARDWSLLASAGGWYAVGLGGKIRSSTEWYDLFGEKGALRRADAGVRMSLGIEWRRLLLRAGYDLGCRNLLKRDYTLPSDPDGDLSALHFNTLRSRNLFIGIGYRF
ncbi:MAG TPA: PorT family protein [Candidatus Alistipes stercoravium]|nr:PorT family protein [Candidatus Alistipes stercoravium]